MYLARCFPCCEGALISVIAIHSCRMFAILSIKQWPLLRAACFEWYKPGPNRAVVLERMWEQRGQQGKETHRL